MSESRQQHVRVKRARSSHKTKPASHDASAEASVEGLSDRERLFADHYRTHFNGTRAYREAGYHAKNDNVAAVEASKLLRKPKVRAYLASRQQNAESRLDLSVDRTLQELARLAFHDPRRLFDAVGNLLPIHQLDEDSARALAGFDVVVMAATEEGNPNAVLHVKKVRFADKGAAIDKLMRYHALYRDSLEVKGPSDLAQQLVEARERLRRHREQKAAEARGYRKSNDPDGQ